LVKATKSVIQEKELWMGENGAETVALLMKRAYAVYKKKVLP
jgi:hypothetical protein